VLRIGVTGGIGAGKSTVARLLAARGAVVIDADAISRELVEPGAAGLGPLVAEFGPRILREDGTLDRGELASLAFSESEGTRRLNAIMHPLIRAEAERRVAEARETGASVVVYDMPLLVETGQQDLVDIVLVVDVSEEQQIARASRTFPEADVRRRMAAQATREERLACADVIIDNGGSLPETEAQVTELWERLDGGRT
jgi:dephospho-CoA kinase